jgi:hypothetical protein
MTRNSGKQAKIIKRRKIIAEYQLRGIDNTWELMALLEKEHQIVVKKATVYNDKTAIEQQWLEDSKQDTATRKANLSQKYEHIYRQAQDAWLKSLEDAETTIQEMIDAGEGGQGRAKVSTTTKKQFGNPALLAQAQAALKAIREMFGVDAPLENNVNLRVDDTVNKALERIYADNSD